MEYIMKIIDDLPHGKKIIFNLFAIEGYTHAEIAEVLNITSVTSRSQYHKAKKLLKEALVNEGRLENVWQR